VTGNMNYTKLLEQVKNNSEVINDSLWYVNPQDIIQSHIQSLQQLHDEMQRVMEEYITEYGTDKYNGQTEYFADKLTKEIEALQALMK